MNQLYDEVVVTQAGLLPGPVLTEAQLDSFAADSVAVFRHEGNYWTIGFKRVFIRMKDVKGLHYLRTLLTAPGRELHVLDLAAGTTRSSTRAVDLVERDRPAAAPGQRARSTVSKSLRACLKRIETVHPALGAHLASTVKTGYYCSYKPDPRAPIEWQT